MKAAKGVITLEFLMIFPMVVGLLYGAAGYGTLFFTKYQMQTAVDRAAGSAFSLDRRDTQDFVAAVETYSNTVLDRLLDTLPPLAVDRLVRQGCQFNLSTSMLECFAEADGTMSAFIPQVTFFGLGAFPPLPEKVIVRSAIPI